MVGEREGVTSPMKTESFMYISTIRVTRITHHCENVSVASRFKYYTITMRGVTATCSHLSSLSRLTLPQTIDTLRAVTPGHDNY